MGFIIFSIDKERRKKLHCLSNCTTQQIEQSETVVSLCVCQKYFELQNIIVAKPNHLLKSACFNVHHEIYVPHKYLYCIRSATPSRILRVHALKSLLKFYPINQRGHRGNDNTNIRPFIAKNAILRMLWWSSFSLCVFSPYVCAWSDYLQSHAQNKVDIWLKDIICH